MTRARKRIAMAALGLWLPALGGCVFLSVPVDVQAGPGRSLRIADADTRQPLPDAMVLLERYRIEGPMHAAPVIRLHALEWVPVGSDGRYRLVRRVHWQQMWLVWMPEVRYSPVREVVALKVFTPRHETAWFAVAGPMEGLEVAQEADGAVLYLRPIETAAADEAAIALIGRHGWPPGPNPIAGDMVVSPEVRAQLAPILIERYEALLARFPDYADAARVRVAIEVWRKALPPNPQERPPADE